MKTCVGVAWPRRPAALVLLVLILIPAGRTAACDISRWPSTARRAPGIRSAGWTEIVVAYRLPAAIGHAEAAQIQGWLRERITDSLPTAPPLRESGGHAREAGPTVSLVDGGATLLLWLERLPADWARLDDAVVAQARGARRETTALSICLPVAQGWIPPRVEQAVARLPELAAASVRFEEGAAVIRFSEGRVPTRELLQRVHQAAMHETGSRLPRGPVPRPARGGEAPSRARTTS